MIETFESFQHGWPNTNGKVLYNGERIGKGKAAFRWFFNRYEQFGDFKNYEDDFYKNVGLWDIAPIGNHKWLANSKKWSIIQKRIQNYNLLSAHKKCHFFRV